MMMFKREESRHRSRECLNLERVLREPLVMRGAQSATHNSRVRLTHRKMSAAQNFLNFQQHTVTLRT